MNRFAKTVLAFVAALSFPLVATAPASATSPDLSQFTYDCNQHALMDFYIPLYANEITITQENCVDYYVVDLADTDNARTPGMMVTSSGNDPFNDLTIDGPVTLEFRDNTAFVVSEITVIEPFEMPNPDGALLADSSQEIPADASAATWGTSDEVDAGDEIQIGGISGCEILPGEHVYATQSFEVTDAGDYTFRVIGTDPISSYLNELNESGSELDDPMVALYSEFDPSDPSTGIVGCNDDLNDLVVGGHDYDENINPYTVTEGGDYIEGHFPYFSSNLTTGSYTLVFTTWGRNTAGDWASDQPDGGEIFFDVWGPDGGLDLTDGGSGSTHKNGSLAETGVDPSFGLWSALTLVASGGVLTVARRRRNRA